MIRLVCCLLLIATTLAGAESASAAAVFTDAEWARAQPATAAPAAAPAAGAALTSIAISLGVVLVLALGLGWAVKRLGVRRLVAGKGRHLEVLESVPVAFKRQACLVRIGDQVVLVGIGEHELCHLATLPAASVLGAAPPPPATPPAAAPAAPSAFQQLLSALGKPGKGSP